MKKPSVARSMLRISTLCFVLWLGAFLYLRNPILFGAESTTDHLKLEAQKIEEDVRFLAGLSPNRSALNEASLLKARDYIDERLKSLGYETHLQEVPGDRGEVFHNVIARYGDPESNHLIVVGAHYDAAGGSNPGADDNASGVAGLLELARLLKEAKPKVKHAIELVAFTLEEPPYFGGHQMGSVVHAKALKAEGKSVELMISLEMLGYYSDELFSQSFPLPLLYGFYPWAGNFIAVVGQPHNRTRTKAFVKQMAGNCSVPVRSINSPSFVPGIDFSDHRSYWELGWPAIMVTDTAFLRNKQYHQLGDTPDRLNYANIAQVIRGVYAALAN